MKLAKYVMKKHKECVVSEKTCSKNFIDFQEKHPGEIAFLNKVAGYMTLTCNVLMGNLWIFRKGFTRNTCKCWLLQLVVTGKSFHQKIFLKKYLIKFDIQWHVLPGIKSITEVWRPFMFILACTWFVQFTSLRALFIWTNGNVMSIV